MELDLSEIGEQEREGEAVDDPDLPPEYCHYRDEGCEFAAYCLNCPFQKCIYEQPRGRQRWLKEMRGKEMVRLFTTEGKEVKELAEMFGVSQRTVQRALKNSLNKGGLPGNE